MSEYRPDPKWPTTSLRDPDPPASGVLRLCRHEGGESSSFDLDLNVPAGVDLMVVLDGVTIYASPASQARGIGRGVGQGGPGRGVINNG